MAGEVCLRWSESSVIGQHRCASICRDMVRLRPPPLQAQSPQEPAARRGSAPAGCRASGDGDRAEPTDCTPTTMASWLALSTSAARSFLPSSSPLLRCHPTTEESIRATGQPPLGVVVGSLAWQCMSSVRCAWYPSGEVVGRHRRSSARRRRRTLSSVQPPDTPATTPDEGGGTGAANRHDTGTSAGGSLTCVAWGLLGHPLLWQSQRIRLAHWLTCISRPERRGTWRAQDKRGGDNDGTRLRLVGSSPPWCASLAQGRSPGCARRIRSRVKNAWINLSSR